MDVLPKSPPPRKPARKLVDSKCDGKNSNQHDYIYIGDGKYICWRCGKEIGEVV